MATKTLTRFSESENFHGRLITPRIGQLWPGQSGRFTGVVAGAPGQPDYCLIQPTHASAIITGAWGPGKKVTGAQSEFDGTANTCAMAEAGSDLAMKVLELDIDGARDFYIAAPREARITVANLADGTGMNWYWTSRQDADWDGHAWAQNFGSGDQLRWHKRDACPALVLRRIPIR